MTLDEVKKMFPTAYRFGKETGMMTATYLNWFRYGYIPLKSQVRLEHITNGKLKARLEDGPKQDIYFTRN